MKSREISYWERTDERLAFQDVLDELLCADGFMFILSINLVDER